MTLNGNIIEFLPLIIQKNITYFRRISWFQERVHTKTLEKMAM